MKIDSGNRPEESVYPQKFEIKESSIKTPTDSYAKSSGEDKEFHHVSLSDVFFRKGEEISSEISKANVHVIKDMISGKEDCAVYRVDFDCIKKGDTSVIRKAIPLSDGTFSLLKEKRIEYGDKEIKEYILVKTDEKGLTRKETQILKIERDKKEREIKPFFNFAKDGRLVVEDGKKCRYFSPDGKEIWQKKIISKYSPVRSAFLSDGSAFVTMGGKTQDTLCMIGPDGSLKWERKIKNANCRLSTDTSGDLYIHNRKNSYQVIHPDGKEERFTPLTGGKNIDSLSVNDRGSVFIIAKEISRIIHFNQGLIVTRSGNKNFTWNAESDRKIIDYAEGKDGSIYFITQKQYNGKIHAIDPDGKTKWEVDLPRTYEFSEHSLIIGKDGNIYASISGVGAGSGTPLPTSYRNLLPSGKGDKLDKDVQTLLLCFSPDGKLHLQYANKNRANYWKAENPPAAQKDGNVVFTEGSNKHVFVVSKDIKKCMKMNQERIDDILKKSYNEIEKAEHAPTIEKDEKKGIVKIGGVELPINIS